MGNIFFYKSVTIESVRSRPQDIQYLEIQPLDLCIDVVQKDGMLLKYIDNQTEEICLLAIRQNATALQYVVNQTDAICSEALQKDVYTIQYIRDQNNSICRNIIEEKPYLITYIRKPSLDMCLDAVRKDGSVLAYIKNQVLSVCLEAVKQNGLALVYVDTNIPDININYDMIALEAVRQNGHVLQYIKNQTLDICMEAIKHIDGKEEDLALINPDYKFIIQHVNCSIFSDDIYLQIMENAMNYNGLLIRFIEPKYHPYLAYHAVSNNGLAIQYIDKSLCDYELCVKAINQNPKAIFYISDPKEELWLIAIRMDWYLIKYCGIKNNKIFKETMITINKINKYNSLNKVEKTVIIEMLCKIYNKYYYYDSLACDDLLDFIRGLIN